jgi:hypothetical protein
MVVPEVDALADYKYLQCLRHLGTGYLLAGDVHGIPITTVPVLRDWFGDRIHTAAVVRHPEKRLLSQLRLFEEFDFSEQAWGKLDYIAGLTGFDKISHLVTGRERHCFVHAANMLNNVIEEHRHCRVFRSEDLTTDPQAFGTFISHISGATVTATDEFVSIVMSRRRINAHRGTGINGDRIAAEWQRAILRAIVKPEAWTLYQQFGYELPLAWGVS